MKHKEAAPVWKRITLIAVAVWVIGGLSWFATPQMKGVMSIVYPPEYTVGREIILPARAESRQTTGGDVALGSCRRCELGGKNYLDEEVVSFEPSSKISFRITDTNLPFASADIRFNLDAQGNTTQVEVSPLYSLKFGLVGRLLDTLVVRRTYRKGMRELLQGLKSHVETSAP